MIIRREGHSASSIHGDKTQMQRENVLSRFRSGKTPVLIATDVASRGLDVDDIGNRSTCNRAKLYFWGFKVSYE